MDSTDQTTTYVRIDLVQAGDSTFVVPHWQYYGCLLGVAVLPYHTGDTQGTLPPVRVRVIVAGKTLLDDCVGRLIEPFEFRAGDAVSVLMTPSPTLLSVEVFLLGWERVDPQLSSSPL